MIYFWAFVIGGLICVIGQLLFDVAKLTPAHTMALLVVTGAVVDALGWYEPMIKFAGAGVTVPITSFGNSLVHGAILDLHKDGWIGAVTGIFKTTSAGISAAIVFSFFAALFVKPKG